MKLFSRILLGLLILVNCIVTPSAHALSEAGGFDASGFQKMSLWESLGLSHYTGQVIKSVFSSQALLSHLKSFSFLLNVVFLIFAILLFNSLRKIVNTTPRDDAFVNKLKILPTALKKDSVEFFNKYCTRLSDGTFECSFSEYSKYHKISRLTLHSALVTLWVKILVVIALLVLNAGFLKAYEGLLSTNYQIFIDSQLAGGGALTSTNYVAETSFGEAIAGPKTTSPNAGYQEYSGISNILDEPSIGIAWGSATNLNFGITSTGSTEYGYHTLTAYYNGDRGYDITVQGSTPTYGDYSITPIGATAVTPAAGTEQFGINLRGNTVPGVVGADPVGGNGAAYGQYAVVNKFAWNSGDVIARATSASPETTYTVTVVMNVSSLTPAGSYVTNLLYSMVPKF